LPFLLSLLSVHLTLSYVKQWFVNIDLKIITIIWSKYIRLSDTADAKWCQWCFVSLFPHICSNKFTVIKFVFPPFFIQNNVNVHFFFTMFLHNQLTFYISKLLINIKSSWRNVCWRQLKLLSLVITLQDLWPYTSRRYVLKQVKFWQQFQTCNLNSSVYIAVTIHS
jgi:hypothetical protein